MLAGAASAALFRRWGTVADRLYAVLLLAGCVMGVIPAIRVLGGAPSPTTALAGSLAGGPWSFGLDPLSAWFVLIILPVGTAAGIFGTAYMAPERAHRSVSVVHGLFAVLLVALVGVVTAQAMMPFLAAWEVMAVSAYLLVVFESERAEVRRAGLIYIVLTHTSLLALFGMFAALSAHSEGRSFAEFAAGNQAESTGRTLALVFALLGFGIKAGAVPLHFWLPGAHAAAPSHVSAVLSGVMLKTGIYGLLRVLDLLGSPPAWFGWTLFGLGLVSGVLGVLWALGQHDLKRLLAYHSVENVGIILLGMGVGVLGVVYGHPVVAVLGFMGALLHTLNHALFKSLLFLGAGAVVRATGTREIDRLGGLARQMPLTALAFGIGSVAIVGLPPLNGFVSEWVVYGALLTAAESREVMRFVVFGAGGLALIGGLALACFSKLDGVLFLGHARARPGDGVTGVEPGPGMVVPALVLAACCAVIGLVPALVLAPARLVAASVAHTMNGASAVPAWAAAATGVSAVAAGVILVAGALILFRGYLRRVGELRVGATWACAGAQLTPRMQYSASSFAAPLLTAFGSLAAVQQIRGPRTFRTHPVDRVQDQVVLPTWRALEDWSRRLRALVGARIRWYLLAVISTLLILLYHLMRWKGGT